MSTLGSILLLAMLLGVPLVMGGVIAWRVGGWAWDKARTRQVVASGVWQPDPGYAGTLREALLGAGMSLPRAEVHHIHRSGHGAEAVWAARFRWSSRGPASTLRQGGQRRVLVMARPGPGPQGVVQHRSGGVFEGAGLAAVEAVSGQPRIEPPGFEWALVHRDPSGAHDGFEPDLGAWLRDALGPYDRLHLGAGHLILSLPDGSMADLMEGGAERLRSLRDRLEAASGG